MKELAEGAFITAEQRIECVTMLERLRTFSKGLRTVGGFDDLVDTAEKLRGQLRIVLEQDSARRWPAKGR